MRDIARNIIHLNNEEIRENMLPVSSAFSAYQISDETGTARVLATRLMLRSSK